MRNHLILATSLAVHACSEPAVREPTQEEADVFMNKLEADEKADKDVAVSEARWEEAERAGAAEARLEDTENESRQEKGR